MNAELFSTKAETLRNIQELNSQNDDFAPSWNILEDKLYFNSLKDGYSYFYITDIKDSVFTTPVFAKGNINKKRNNQSYISFYNDEAILSSFHQALGRSYLNLYRSEKRKGLWFTPFHDDSLKSESFTAQASISPDGEFIIFVSNRVSEYSDTDLWMANRQANDTWGEVRRLDEINSPGNEITPYLMSADTLLFSSDEQGGPGGYDIYMSINIDGLWQRPVLVDHINTEFNESDPCSIDNMLIFSSDRPDGLGGLDLYSVLISKEEIDSKEEEINLNFETYVSSILTKTKRKLSYAYSEIPINKEQYPEYTSIKRIATNTYELRIDDVEVLPPYLEVFFSSNEIEIKDWTAQYFCSGRNMVDIDGVNKREQKITIDLRKHKHELAECDSFTVKVKSFDQNLREFSDDLSLFINHNLETDFHKELVDAKRYYETFIAGEISDEKLFRDYLRFIWKECGGFSEILILGEEVATNKVGDLISGMRYKSVKINKKNEAIENGFIKILFY